MVIGAGGFLGRALSALLEASGDTVVRASSADGTGIDPATGLLREHFAVPDGTQVVYYLAQSPRPAQSAKNAAHLLAVNVHSAVRAATLAADAGVERFFYASTGTVYGPSFTPLSEHDPVRRDAWYPLSKLQAEEALALLADMLDVTCARIFGLYGPGQSGRLVPNLVRTLRSGRPVMIEPPAGGAADGGLRISLLHVADCAAMLRELAGVHRVPILNLASNEALSIREIALAIASRIGVDPDFRAAPAARAGDLVADTRLLDRVVLHRPRSFAQGLADVLTDSQESPP